VYVGVPAPNDVVVDSAAVWPALIVIGLTDITGAVSAGFTVAETATELTSSGGEPASVTVSSKDQEPAVDKTPVEVVGLSPALHANELPRLLYPAAPGAFASH
jgi:hypothetical protein